MNILHIDEQTGWRGGEQQAGYLIAGLGERGHQCSIAGRPGSPFVQADHGGRVSARLELPLRGEFDGVSAARIAAFARKHGVQILHAHTAHAHMIACLARMFAGSLKVVVSRRVDFAPSSNRFSRYKYALPDHYVAISNAVGRVLAAYGIPDAKRSVVHSGIDLKRLDVPARSRAELGLPERGPLIGNVAALVGHKDHRTLISAMPAVVDAVPEAHLVIVGEGPLRPAIEDQIRSLNLTHRVHLLGYRDDVPAILKALDVFVLSSSEEGLGTSVLDAMAAGVPVAATAAGGIPEAVRHEETGLLSAPGEPGPLAESLLRLLRGRPFAEALARSARSLVASDFSADAMVEGNLAVYESVLGAE